jgi:hypothetical protein
MGENDPESFPIFDKITPMKKLLWVWIFSMALSAHAQKNEEIAVQKTIETFFEGFHKQDSVLIKSTVSAEIILQTVARDESGNPILRTQEFSGFLKSIVGIPQTTKFQEIIKSYSIQIDGPMANAWTAYEFRLNDNFSHCGVNSFQLLKDSKNVWRIIYLIDTRGKENCD